MELHNNSANVNMHVALPPIITEDAAVLPPDSPYGIPVFTMVGYTENARDKFPAFTCQTPLKSYNQLMAEFPKGRKPEMLNARKTELEVNAFHNDYIYFRVPSTYPIELRGSKPYPIDNPARLSDIKAFPLWYAGKSIYDRFKTGDMEHLGTHIVLVKVDPERTNVYYSDFRPKGIDPKISKMKLSDYIARLRSNINPGVGVTMDPRWNERWEIVVKVPQISPEYYMKCYTQDSVKSAVKSPAEKMYYDILKSDEFDRANWAFFQGDISTLETIYKDATYKIKTAKDGGIENTKYIELLTIIFNRLLGPGINRVVFDDSYPPHKKAIFKEVFSKTRDYMELYRQMNLRTNNVYRAKSKQKKEEAGVTLEAAKAAFAAKQTEIIEYLKINVPILTAKGGGKGKTMRRRHHKRTQKRRN